MKEVHETMEGEELGWNAKPYICHICGEKFRKSIQVQAHIITHTENEDVVNQHNEINTSSTRDVSLSLYGREVTLPSNRRKVTLPSNRREVTLPSNRREVTLPSNRREVTLPSNRREVTLPSNRREVTLPSNRREITLISNTCEEFAVRTIAGAVHRPEKFDATKKTNKNGNSKREITLPCYTNTKETHQSFSMATAVKEELAYSNDNAKIKRTEMSDFKANKEDKEWIDNKADIETTVAYDRFLNSIISINRNEVNDNGKPQCIEIRVKVEHDDTYDGSLQTNEEEDSYDIENEEDLRTNEEGGISDIANEEDLGTNEEGGSSDIANEEDLGTNEEGDSSDIANDKDNYNGYNQNNEFATDYDDLLNWVSHSLGTDGIHDSDSVNSDEEDSIELNDTTDSEDYAGGGPVTPLDCETTNNVSRHNPPTETESGTLYSETSDKIVSPSMSTQKHQGYASSSNQEHELIPYHQNTKKSTPYKESNGKDGRVMSLNETDGRVMSLNGTDGRVMALNGTDGRVMALNGMDDHVMYSKGTNVMSSSSEDNEMWELNLRKKTNSYKEFPKKKRRKTKGENQSNDFWKSLRNESVFNYKTLTTKMACPKCDKKFKKFNKLRSHLLFPCNETKKVTNHRRPLLVEQTTNVFPPFPASESIAQRNSESGALKRTSDKEKPCITCQEAMSGNLNSVDRNGNGRYTCPTCGKQFIKIPLLGNASIDGLNKWIQKSVKEKQDKSQAGILDLGNSHEGLKVKDTVQEQNIVTKELSTRVNNNNKEESSLMLSLTTQSDLQLASQSLTTQSDLQLAPQSLTTQSDLQLAPQSLTTKSDRQLAPRSLMTQSDLQLSPRSLMTQSDLQLAPQSLTTKSDRQLAPQSLTTQSDLQLVPQSLTTQSDRQLAPRSLTTQSDRQLAPRSLTTPSDRQLAPYMLMNERIVKPYRCHVCDSYFHQSQELKRHILTHTDERPFKCSACAQNFRQLDDFILHMNTHSGELPHTCQESHRAFTQSQHHKGHLKMHAKSKVTTDICDGKMHSKSKVSALICDGELNSKSPKEAKKTPSTSDCQFVSYELDGRSSIQSISNQSIHLDTHQKANTKNPEGTRKGNKTHECNICGKCFRQSQQLKRHIRVHTDERPNQCTVCSKGFREASDLKRHMRIHSGERPYKCEACLMTFTQTQHLNKHIALHCKKQKKRMNAKVHKCGTPNEECKKQKKRINAKVHKCGTCNEACRSVCELDLHRRKHRYKCAVCDKSFSHANDLNRHERIHTGDCEYTCATCGKAFNRSFTLLRHLKIHANRSSVQKPFKCDECDKTFTKLIYLEKHKQVHSIS